MEKIKMGFVGSGRMGQLAHIANYYEIEDCELAALAEGKKELAQKVAEKYGIKKVYANHIQLADDRDVQAVAVVLQAALNYHIVKDLLNAGKHVITEKPMGINLKNMEELVNLAEKKGLVYQVGYMKRHDTGYKMFKKSISEYLVTGEFGRLQQVRLWCFCGEWIYKLDRFIRTDEKPPDSPKEEYPSWMPDRLKGFYGRLLNIEVHLINLLRYLVGEDFAIEHVSYTNDANFTIIAKTSSGTRVVFEGGAVVTNHRWHEGVEIFFDKAILKAESAPPMLRQGYAGIEFSFQGESKKIVRPIPEARWAFMEQAEHFVRSVAGEEVPVSPAKEGLKDIAFCENAVRCLLAQNGK
ncbi:MAG TPA: Gfo/Idh/MocA family oxidoreductase [bacterium]|nr:Gfo/Idh/MocA family oxidoreductase [bacterium]